MSPPFFWKALSEMIGLFCYLYSVPMGLKHHLIRVVFWFLHFMMEFLAYMSWA